MSGWSWLQSMGLGLGLFYCFLFLLCLTATLTYSSHGESPECKEGKADCKSTLEACLCLCQVMLGNIPLAKQIVQSNPTLMMPGSICHPCQQELQTYTAKGMDA